MTSGLRGTLRRTSTGWRLATSVIVAAAMGYLVSCSPVTFSASTIERDSGVEILDLRFGFGASDGAAAFGLAVLWLNRDELRWPMIGWFALGAIPCAVTGGLLLARAPLAPLKAVLGVFLIGVVVWRRLPRSSTPPPGGAGVHRGGRGVRSRVRTAGLVGPLTAPFFLAAGLTRA